MTTARTKPGSSHKRTASEPAKQLVVTSNRPKLRIQDHATSLVFVIPGFNWQSVALAHMIAGQLLIEAGDLGWQWIMAPRVDPGDRLMTCTLVRVDFNIVGLEDLAIRMTAMLRYAVDAAKKVVQPVGAREPSHEVILDVDRTQAIARKRP